MARSARLGDCTNSRRLSMPAHGFGTGDITDGVDRSASHWMGCAFQLVKAGARDAVVLWQTDIEQHPVSCVMVTLGLGVGVDLLVGH